jgi:hypothetical protein
MGFQYEPLDDEHIFENFILDLFNAMHQTNSFQLYKSKGTVQHGIDVFSTEKKIVIQCKKKDLSRSEKTLKGELIKDFDKSLELVKELPFNFETFFLASNTKKFGTIQDYAAVLSEKSTFEVRFMSWKDIEKNISKHPDIREMYFPHLEKSATSHLKGDSPENINNLKHRKSIVSQKVSGSTINNLHQIGGDLNIRTTKKPDIRILPSIGSIGANSFLKQKIIELFNKIGEEREPRFGKQAYTVMYKNFKRDFEIKNLPWTIIWVWPEACAKIIIDYLDQKYDNTIGGRIKNADVRQNRIPKRPSLYSREKELLEQIGLTMSSNEVTKNLWEYFRVTSHTKLSHLQHWQWVIHLEEEVRKRVGEEYNGEQNF